jgi:hypothetical protein
MKMKNPSLEQLQDQLPRRRKSASVATRLLHDVGLAVWFGGSLMGILAVNPAVEVLDDVEERGNMVDVAWSRFHPYSALGLFTVFVTHVILRRRGPRSASGKYKTFARIQDFALLGAFASSVASLALGEYTGGPDVEVNEGSGEQAENNEESNAGGISPAGWAQIGTGALLFLCGAILAHERDQR